MIFLIVRIVLLVAGILFIYYILRKLMTPSDFVACGRCEGKGFWYAARGKETCDWCKGSGKLPREVS